MMKDFVDHRMEKIMRTYLVTGGAGFIGSNYIPVSYTHLTLPTIA